MRTSPCYGCTMRSARCHAECKDYAEWAAENEQRRMRDREPHTFGGDEQRMKREREAVRQRRYLRHNHGEKG